MKILNQIKFSKKPIIFSPSYLLICLLLSNVIACGGCKNKKSPNANNPKLTLSTNKCEYQGEKDLNIELLIEHKDPEAKQTILYDHLSLEITVTQENTIEKSLITYESFDTAGAGTNKQISSVIEKLTNLFKVTHTDSIAPTQQLKKIFTLIPKGNPTKIIITYKLLDTANSNEVIEKCSVTYRNAPTGAWQFEIIGADPTTHIRTLEDPATDLEIKVYQAGDTALKEEELKELKLYIKRTTPGKANINNLEDGVFELKGTNQLLLASDGKSATKKLKINLNADKKIAFELQLQDKTGANLGVIQKIVWEKPEQLELKAQYDLNHKEVTITVNNSGKLTLPANQAKLTWDTGYPTVTIDGKQQDHEDIGALKPNEDFVFLLRNVHFADPTHTSIATLKLELTWQKLEAPLQISCPLTAIPIDVTITKLEFNKSTNQIVYTIKNNGKEDLALQLKCTHSNPHHGGAATITTPLPIDLKLTKVGNTSSETEEKTLQVDFKGENLADFKLELLLGGHPINFKYNAKDGAGEKEVNQTIVTCKSKEVNLKFTDTKGSHFSNTGFNLQGDNKEIQFKIDLNGNPTELVALNQIDKTKLKLLLTTTSGDAKIKQGTNTVTEIQGNHLHLGGENTLSIERGASNQASFKFQLMCDTKGDGKFTKELATLPVIWKEDTFEITVMNPIENNELIEKEPASFFLQNTTGNTIPAGIEIELKNVDGATFQFLKKQADDFAPVGYSTGTLDQLLGTHASINTKTIIGPIYFCLIHANNQANTDVYIVVKKDGHEVAKTDQPIRWRAKKVAIEIVNILKSGKAITDNLLIDEGSDKDIAQAFTIILQNEGENINTNDVEVHLTNENKVQFKLGKGIGDHIDTDLLYILGRSIGANTTFPKATTKAFTLQLSDHNPPFFSKITLIISSLHNGALAKKELLWVNLAAITQRVQTTKNLRNRLDEIAGNATPYSFDKILENITNDSNIQADKKTLLNLLTGPILYGSMDMNKNFIENSGMKGILREIKNILEQLQKINQQVKAANNNQDIVFIKQAIDGVGRSYNDGQRVLERKVTKFAQQILLVGQKHLRQAQIENQANGQMAEFKYFQVFKPLEKVINALVKSAPTPSSPAKSSNHQLNHIFQKISNIIAQTQEEVAKKYEQDKNDEKAAAFRKMAETWRQGAKAYTGV